MRRVGEMRRVVDLGEMKKENGLKGFGLFRQTCMSVVPVPKEVWKRVCEIGGGYEEDEREYGEAEVGDHGGG